jgi:hypothetical protein
MGAVPHTGFLHETPPRTLPPEDKLLKPKLFSDYRLSSDDNYMRPEASGGAYNLITDCLPSGFDESQVCLECGAAAAP